MNKRFSGPELCALKRVQFLQQRKLQMLNLLYILSIEQIFVHGTIPRHLELFVRLTHQRPVPGPLLPHILHHILDTLPIQPLVDLESETADVLGDSLPQQVALLTDTSRKNQGVDFTMQGHVVAPDVAADPVHEDVKGQLHLGLGGRGDDPEVGGPRQGFPAGFFVEDLFGSGDVEGFGGGGGEFPYVCSIVEYETVSLTVRISLIKRRSLEEE